MSGLEPKIQQGAGGDTQKLTVDAEVVVFSSGEGIEQQAVLLLADEELPINLADLLENHFGRGQTSEQRQYGPLRITIERV